MIKLYPIYFLIPAYSFHGTHITMSELPNDCASVVAYLTQQPEVAYESWWGEGTVKKLTMKSYERSRLVACLADQAARVNGQAQSPWMIIAQERENSTSGEGTLQLFCTEKNRQLKLSQYAPLQAFQAIVGRTQRGWRYAAASNVSANGYTLMTKTDEADYQPAHIITLFLNNQKERDNFICWTTVSLHR